MKFEKFRDAVQLQFDRMTLNPKSDLFVVDVSGDDLWNLYMSSFSSEENPIYRVRTQHDCSSCRNFIKHIGNVVTIENNKVVSVWDVLQNDDSCYSRVCKRLAEEVRKHSIVDFFYSKERAFGCKVNFSVDEDGSVVSWSHLHCKIPNAFIRQNVSEEKAYLRDSRNVLERTLRETSLSTIDTVIELITSASLYRGNEWLHSLNNLRDLKVVYDTLSTDTEKSLYCWSITRTLSNGVSRIRNHSIGTLLVNIESGMPLESAVSQYERIVAPTNYHRPKAVYTKRMLDEAMKDIQNLGLDNSFDRRFATQSDVEVDNRIFSFVSNNSTQDSIFQKLQNGASSSVDVSKFENIPEMNIDEFIQDSQLSIQSMQILVEPRHEPNFVSLLAPLNSNCPSITKWSNGFTWAYSGNLSDSDITRNVKKAGGNVDGDVRFSIQWNDKDVHRNDLDAHCVFSDRSSCTRREIFYSNRNGIPEGYLDVDIIHPDIGKPAVENIVFSDHRKMLPGKYTFFVHPFSYSGGDSGFRAELFVNGELKSFDYDKPVRHDVTVATLTVTSSGISVDTQLPCVKSSFNSSIWNVPANSFVPVDLVCLSPNYWKDSSGSGNKHYMFFLSDCKNPDPANINGVLNEYVRNELSPHKHVLEALGYKTSVDPCDKQLSGLGFSSTLRNNFVCKVSYRDGKQKVIRIKF